MNRQRKNSYDREYVSGGRLMSGVANLKISISGVRVIGETLA